MNKSKKNKELIDYSEYISEGIIEVGKEKNMDVQVTNIVKTRQGKMPDAVFVLQSFAQKVANKKNYSAATFRVLMHFFGLSQYENFVSIDVKSIAEDLDITEGTVK
jgi:hypothetical protein